MSSGQPFGLPSRVRNLLLLIAVGVFLLTNGGFYNGPRKLDAAIAWSYFVVPPLVLVALVLLKRLRVWDFVVSTIEVALYKYAITFSLAMVTWMIYPATPVPGSAIGDARPVRSATPPSDPKGPTRKLQITVLSADAHTPVQGALAFLTDGLGAFAFPGVLPTKEIVHDGRRLSSSMLQVFSGQFVRFSTLDGRLHTFSGSRTDGPAFNFPMVGAAPQPVFRRIQPGEYRVRCTVHSVEPESTIEIFPTPFFSNTNAFGAVEFAHVPSLPSQISVRAAGFTAQTFPIASDARDVVVELTRRD